jgi:hypothetical protein
MAKLIGFIIGNIINVIGIIVMLPFAIIGGIFSGITRASNAERNQQNGADIRALCTELGVPSEAYNRIVINQMDTAKNIALKIGEPGQAHQSSPWNTRLAIAIASLYQEQSGDSAQVNDLLVALKNYISSYTEEHGSPPETVMLDHNIHMMFAEAGVYRNTKQHFGEVNIIPTANIEGDVTWKAITPATSERSLDDFYDDIPYNEFESDELYNETEGQAGKNDIVANITQGVNSRISSERVALQFVLEELDAARQGNEVALQFVKNSGFSPSEYEGAMQNSFEEVDGPDGPQQFLLSSVMQYSSDMDFMVNLRLKVVENIIHDWGLNKQEKGRTDNLLQSLRNILEDDDSVMAALTKNIPVPASAQTRHVHFRRKNIDSARDIVSSLSVITGDDVDTIIKTALQITPQEDDEISQDEIIAKLSRLSESENIKTCRMSIQPIKEIWSWDFEFSDEELEVANDLVSVLYDMRNGDFIAPVYNIVKQKKSASSSFDEFDDDIPF